MALEIDATIDGVGCITCSGQKAPTLGAGGSSGRGERGVCDLIYAATVDEDYLWMQFQGVDFSVKQGMNGTTQDLALSK